MSGEREHWERVYTERAPDAVSWFEAVPRSSLAMIEAIELSLDAANIDVGGGASRLGSELLRRGYSDITVADISGEAMRRARDGLSEPDRINWVLGDVRSHDFERRFAVWHDVRCFTSWSYPPTGTPTWTRWPGERHGGGVQRWCDPGQRHGDDTGGEHEQDAAQDGLRELVAVDGATERGVHQHADRERRQAVERSLAALKGGAQPPDGQPGGEGASTTSENRPSKLRLLACPDALAQTPASSGPKTATAINETVSAWEQ